MINILDSIFLVMFIAAFILTVLGEREESVGYNMMAIVIWLVLTIQCWYIVDVGGTLYQEPGVGAIALGFTFVNLILILDYFFDFMRKKQGPARF